MDTMGSVDLLQMLSDQELWPALMELFDNNRSQKTLYDFIRRRSRSSVATYVLHLNEQMAS